VAFDADSYYWRDLGRLESIANAAHEISEGFYPW